MTPFVGLSMTDHVLVVDLSDEDAGPSTTLRSAQDDTFVGLSMTRSWLSTLAAKMQVLRLRFAPLRMTPFIFTYDEDNFLVAYDEGD